MLCTTSNAVYDRQHTLTPDLLNMTTLFTSGSSSNLIIFYERTHAYLRPILKNRNPARTSYKMLTQKSNTSLAQLDYLVRKARILNFLYYFNSDICRDKRFHQFRSSW